MLNFKQKQRKYGFKYQQLLVWDKGNAVANRYYMNAVEFVLMLRKGGAKDIINRRNKEYIKNTKYCRQQKASDRKAYFFNGNTCNKFKQCWRCCT